MIDKLYKNNDWLYEQYITNMDDRGLSEKEHAAELKWVKNL